MGCSTCSTCSTVRVAVLIAACGSGCQFDRPADVGHSVGGSLTGMWDGGQATLDLLIEEASQTISVDRNGTFWFPDDVADGAAYEIRVQAPTAHTCVVADGTGVVTGADIANVRVTCEGPAVRVELSAASEWAFDPGALDQQIPLSLLASSLSLRATHEALTGVSLDGVDVALGVWSAYRGLTYGAQTWTLMLHAGAMAQTYRLTIDRGSRAMTQVLYAKSSNGMAEDYFGAWLAVSPDALVVGAHLHDDMRVDGGATYVFRRSADAWTEEAYLTTIGQSDRDHVGPVAVSGDLIVAGAPGQQCGMPGPRPTCDSSSAPGSGAAYVFRRAAAGGWQQEIMLKASNPEADDHFGSSVAIHDGVIVVGAPGEDSAATTVDGDGTSNAAPAAGAAYVFTFDGTSWGQAAYLKAANAGAGDGFGSSVAIHGADIVIGAPGEASMSVSGMEQPADNSGASTGAAYVYRRALSWQQVAYLKGDTAAIGGKFGTSVAIGDRRIVVGAPDAGNSAGRAYTFERSGSAWDSAQPIVATDADGEDAFGFAVSLAGDLIAIGAPGEGGEAAGIDPPIRDDTSGFVGAVYLFRRVGNAWFEESYVKASNPDGDDIFGSAVGLSADSVCIGAPAEDSATRGLNGDGQSDGSPSSGAIYCFR